MGSFPGGTILFFQFCCLNLYRVSHKSTADINCESLKSTSTPDSNRFRELKLTICSLDCWIQGVRNVNPGASQVILLTTSEFQLFDFLQGKPLINEHRD